MGRAVVVVVLLLLMMLLLMLLVALIVSGKSLWVMGIRLTITGGDVCDEVYCLAKVCGSKLVDII